MLREPPGHPDHDARVALPACSPRRRARCSASVETVIVDEVHAVAGTKRGAHLALIAGAARRAARAADAAHRPLRDAAAARGDRPLRLRRPPDRARRRGHAEGARPRGRRAGRGHARARRGPRPRQPVMPDGVEMARLRATARSIWPSIYPALLELVREHRSTIVFVNNRRLAERLALRLNELAEEEIARAHHGSLAREQRVEIEELLKAGRIPCLVATSSLELGIDMGAVDLVVQVESPKSVARGLQRIGRAGHELGAVSKGRVFPKFRADLLECAVVAQRDARAARSRRRRSRATRSTCSPSRSSRSCAEDEIEVDELHRLVRGAYPFADLSRAAARERARHARRPLSVGRVRRAAAADRLGPDGGRDPRPARARGGSRSRTRARSPTAASSACTSSTAAAASASSTRRWSTRRAQGQTFLLGASTWRIEEITRDRVLVSPAPGVPGAVPFWKGEGVGRPYELGERRSARASRELVALDATPRRSTSLRQRLPPRRARGAEPPHVPARAGGGDGRRPVRPHRRRRALPRRDRRLARLHPHAVRRPRARAVGDGARGAAARLARPRGAVDLVGRRHRAPPARRRRAASRRRAADRPGRDRGARRRRRSARRALFGARFRENAARALLIPRRRPGQRTPLWQQRLKAQSLLQVARKYGSFPIVLETYRECLQDVFDLPALKRILHGLQTRELDLVEVETASASPFAASLLFDYVATYMYEDDTPPAERRAQALSLDRDLLRELLGQEELRELIDPDALAEVEAQLRGRAARTPTSCTTCSGGAATCVAGEYDEGFAGDRCSPSGGRCAVRLAGEERLIAAEDAGRYRDALGAMPPGGLPEAFLEGGAESLRQLVLRFAQGPRAVHDGARPSARFGLPTSSGLLRALERRGPARPRRAAPRRHRARVVRSGRAAPAAPRLAGRAAPRGRAGRAGRARPLPARLARDRPARRRCARRSCRCRGSPLPVSLWESEVLPRRVPGYQPAWLDAAVRARRGRLGRRGARPRRRLLPRRRAAARPPAGAPPPEGEAHDAIRAALAAQRRVLVRPARRGGRARARGGAARALGARLGGRGDERRLGAAACRPPLRDAARPAPPAAPLLAHARRPRSRRRRAAGRSPTGSSPATPDRRALAELLLERQGIVTRDGVRGEGIPGGYGAVYGELKRLETLGACRRGYFVEGLGGAQFALAGRGRAAARAARPRTRTSPSRSCSRRPIRRSRTAPRCRGRGGPARGRPASPARTSSCSAARRRSSSSAAAARSCRCASRTRLAAARARGARRSTCARGGGKRLAVERFDGRPVAETEVMPLLVEAGFLAGPRRAVLRP